MTLHLRRHLLAMLIGILLPSAIAAQSLDSKVKSAAEKGQVALLAELFERGAHVNATDRNGRTALMFAAEKGQVDVVRFLLDKGATVLLADNRSKTARMLAAEKKHPGIVAVLDRRLEELDAELDRAIRNQVRELTATYTEGVTTHDQVRKTFSRTSYSDRELAMVYSARHTIGRDSAEVQSKAQGTPDYGVVGLGYYTGTGTQNYSSNPRGFVLIAELYFLKGVLTPKARVPWVAAYGPSRSTTLTRGLSVRGAGGSVLTLSETRYTTIAPVDEKGTVDASRSDQVLHEQVNLDTPLFTAKSIR